VISGSEPTAPAEAKRYGRYAILRALGGGAMGDVFQARDTVLGREVALKVMKPSGPGLDTFKARFEAEARALASLHHLAAVQVFDVGWEGAEPYLVMELVPGGTLKDRLDAGRLGPDEVRTLGIRVGGALAAAHARGILHRDLKPGNVLGGPGGWKLADFGIAHVPGSELTMTGQFLGTPAYAAPESLGKGEFSPASDVYGLGATLYAALTGEPPYGGHLGSLTTIALAPIEAKVPEAPAGLIAAITAALDRDPAGRPTAQAMVERLAHEGPASSAVMAALTPPPPSPPAWTSAALAAPTPQPSPATTSSGSLVRAPAQAARPRGWMTIAGIAVAAAIVIGLVASSGGRGGGPPTAPMVPSPGLVPPPTTADPTELTGAAQPLPPQPCAARVPQMYSGHPKLLKKLRDAVRKFGEGKFDEAAAKAREVVDEDPEAAEVADFYRDLLACGAQPGREED